jgi:hypothetical protein
MRIYRTISLTVFTAGLLFCRLANAEDLPSASATDASAADASAPAAAASVADQAGGGNAAPSSNLETNFSTYVWFPGIHGTLSAFGYNAYYRATPGDLINHSGLAANGLFGLKYKRLVFIGDFAYAPLKVTRGKLFSGLPNQPFVSGDFKYTQFILDPEVGFRMLDGPKLKVDALIGWRFWHNGITLNVTTPNISTHSYVQNNWADLVLGARIVYELTPKLSASVWGDGGGFGAGAQVDYNIVGVLTYRLKRRVSVNVGWRYLFVDYQPHFLSSSIAESGVVFGSTIHLSGRQ